jgi:predicted AlkP superfamily phosphohydrolase/phosphomutase
MKHKKKVLIVGLDGFTWRIGKKMIREGHLPVLGKLIEQGVHGNLNSIVPAETSPAWSSFQTGCRPDKTGVFAFHGFQRATQNIKLNSFQEIKVPTIWELLSAAGKKVVSINMPMTSPPPRINGVIIPGLTCPALSRQTTYPPEVYDKYISPNPDYLIVNNEHQPTLSDYVAQAVRTEENRCHLALQLMHDIEWDLFSIQIQSTDVFQHRNWYALDPQAEGFTEEAYAEALVLYKNIDAILGRLIEAAGQPLLTIVVSDHGFRVKKAEIGINTWLAQNGYLFLDSTVKTSASVNLKEKLKKSLPILKSLAKVYGKILHSFKQRGQETKSDLYAEKVVKHIRETIDMDQTSAFSLGGMAGLLYLTDRTHKEKAQQIIKQLLTAYGPASPDPLIRNIQPVDTFYQYTEENYPDYIISFMPGVGARINPDGEIVDPGITDGKHSGIHEEEGVLVLHGPSVKSGLHLNANIIDIAPTVLSYFSSSIPRHIDGKSLNNAFIDGIDIHYTESEKSSKNDLIYSDREQNSVEKQLKDLGYL